MADEGRSRERYGEAFWRAHHEAWRQGDLISESDSVAHLHHRGQWEDLMLFAKWRAGLLTVHESRASWRPSANTGQSSSWLLQLLRVSCQMPVARLRAASSDTKPNLRKRRLHVPQK